MKSEVKYCSQCGAEVDISSKFCMHCGFKFPTQDLEKNINQEFKNNVDNKIHQETNIVKDSIDISQYFYLFENNEETNNIIDAIKQLDWDNALTSIDQLIEKDNSDSNLWALKSYVLFKLNYFKDSITSVNMSLNLDYFSQFAWACKALILDILNENVAAISCCNEFLTLNPTNADIIQLKIKLNDKINNNLTNGIEKEPETQDVSSNINDSSYTTSPSVESNEIRSSSDSNNVNPWSTNSEISQNNPWQNSDIEYNNPWEIKINPNDNFNFTGDYKYHYTEFKQIFTPENRNKLQSNHLTPTQYKDIFTKIKSTSDNLLNKTIKENNIDFDSLSAFEKVLLFTKSFVEVDYKAGGADLGNYAFNRINLDDRLDTSNQITTLIHELSHHLLAEIFEQSTMIILNTDKTIAIEAFVAFSLMCANPSILLNEYCAHTVEGRFTPHGYQNYGSFENILQRFDIRRDRDVIFMCMTVGNTFCKDILTIMEAFIDYNLREEIKQQFKKDYNFPPNYQGISLEIRDTMPITQLIDFINFILLMGFDTALRDPEGLLSFQRQFELHNMKGGI